MTYRRARGRWLVSIGACMLSSLVLVSRGSAHAGEEHGSGISELAHATDLRLFGLVVLVGAGFWWIAYRNRSDRPSSNGAGPESAIGGEERPDARHTSERMPAGLLEFDTGAGHEVLDRARDEHLSRRRQ